MLFRTRTLYEHVDSYANFAYSILALVPQAFVPFQHRAPSGIDRRNKSEGQSDLIAAF